MYNHQLDTFVKVAELGSFTKAAEEMYISASAVQQQINNLEANLGVKLFERTRRSIVLTAAGELLYAEAPKLISISHDLKAKVLALRPDEKREICFGSSASEPFHLLFKLWSRFTESRGEEFTVRFKPVASIGRRKEWEDVDIMEGVYVGDFSEEKFDFVRLTDVPVVFAVWKEHPLAKKEMLRYEDMRGLTLMTIGGEEHLTENIIALRREAEECGMKVITADYYDSSIYDRCVLNGYVMQTALTDSYAQHGMIAIPCNREYNVPYGLYCRKDASAAAAEFISFIKEVAKNM